MSRYSRISATGRFLPDIEVSNDLLRKRFAHLPEFVDKAEAASGIRCRWHAPDDWATSDVALPAASQALERAGKAPEDVDLIILGTDSPDYITPATSVVLQYKLGARRAGSFDVGCGCASFAAGLAAGAGLIAASAAVNTVLVVGVYLMHKLAGESDPMSFYYGDGAGAAVLEASDAPGFLNASFLADGYYQKHWGIFSGGTYEPATVASVRAGRTQVKVLERYPPELDHETWPRMVRALAKDGGFAVPDVDFILFTQARKPSIDLVMGELGLPADRTHTIMEEWGYTGSASLPMALDDAVAKGKVALGSGALTLFIGSGIGYSVAGAAFRL